MSEEKSAPKKEKAPKKVAAADAAPAAEAKPAKEKAPKAHAAEGAPPAAPVELVGGVPKAATAEDLLKEELASIKVRKAKGSKNISPGIANIAATYNNTIVSITDAKGNVISWSSAGKCNFRGSR